MLQYKLIMVEEMLAKTGSAAGHLHQHLFTSNLRPFSPNATSISFMSASKSPQIYARKDTRHLSGAIVANIATKSRTAWDIKHAKKLDSHPGASDERLHVRAS